MTYELVAALLWSILPLSLLLALAALGRRSWRLMLLAVFLSLVFTLAAALSVGPYAALLTNLFVAAALALRWRLSGWGWSILALAALAIWLLIAPLQVFVFRWPPLELLELVAVWGGVIATLVGPRSRPGEENA